MGSCAAPSAKGDDKFITTDYLQQCLTLWLPWRIGFVRGGNHSIASGVLAGEGEVIPDTVYDMRYLLDIVSTDGYYWYMSGKICERVSDYRTAAFFEIGRLLTL
ncbi:DUF6710 family protein (plasmid) [Escherichia coli]|nr:DUF6710 family protein [Escherichia coli]